MVVEDGDVSAALGQLPKGSCDDAEDVAVELVEFVLRPAVAGIAPALREPRYAVGWITHSDRYARIVEIAEPAAGDDERQRGLGVRDDAVGPRDHRGRLDAPADGRVTLNEGDAGFSERDEPRLGSGADDPPLRRVE